METLDRLIFRSEHWQIFLIFVVLTFVELVSGFSVMGIALLTYQIMLGVTLRNYLPPNFQGTYRTFRVAGVLGLALLIYILEFGSFGRDPGSFIFVAGIFVAYLIVLSFVAKAIKAIETGDNSVDFGDYFWEVILLAFFFPLGVWFLQPRLNALGDRFSS